MPAVSALLLRACQVPAAASPPPPTSSHEADSLMPPPRSLAAGDLDSRGKSAPRASSAGSLWPSSTPASCADYDHPAGLADWSPVSPRGRLRPRQLRLGIRTAACSGRSRPAHAPGSGFSLVPAWLRLAGAPRADSKPGLPAARPGRLLAPRQLRARPAGCATRPPASSTAACARHPAGPVAGSRALPPVAPLPAPPQPGPHARTTVLPALCSVCS
ncbi:hypothetical protein VPH35_115628 [Triticum aestivum]|nr:protein enabled homolog [Aegilops tauschii subsp. strangulata]